MNLGWKLVVLLSCVAVASCDSKNLPFGDDEYETTEYQGDLYLVNKNTGEMVRVDGDNLVVLQTLRKSSIPPSKHSVEFDRTFGTDSVFRIEGKVKEIGDSVKILGVVYPYIKEIDDARGDAGDNYLFNVHLVETDGFRLGALMISASDLTTSVSTGKRTGFTFQQEIYITMDQFRAATGIDVTWYPKLDAATENWLKTDEGVSFKAAKEKEVQDFLDEISEGTDEE